MRGVADIAGKMRLARSLALAALVMLPLGAGDALAASAVCRQLQGQLASLPSASGGGRQARRYDQAIATQMREMEKARAQARQAGCGRGFLARSAAVCGNLNATLSRMETNLATLQGRRAQLGGSAGNTRRERTRIQAALQVNGCNEPQRTLPEPVKQQPVKQEPAKQQPAGTVVIDGRSGLRVGDAPGGSFRTLCVRSCDGYYFPISYGVTSASFPRDRNVCEAMCPGTEVDLFYHRVPGEESEDMVSASTGLPYSELENAFLYRRRADAPDRPACRCRTTAASTQERGFEIIGGKDKTSGEQASLPVPAPVPEKEPVPAEDEARASLSRAAEMVPEEREIDPDRQVRQVGPRFFPDPEGAIDLRAPAPAPVP